MITYAPQPSLLSNLNLKIRSWSLLGFITVLSVAFFFNFYGLEKIGYANSYYAAAVRSMMQDPAAFFFNSLDTGLFVTVDKPPVGLWVQVVSAWIFGYSGWALLFPQAFAGVLSVALLYVLVQRTWGAKAAFIAALVLAVSPVSVATNRNNTMDSQLVFVLLLAALAISFATERGQLRWLIVSAVLVGIGFNIKMLQAYMVLPAFYLVYLLAARTAWWKRFIHLGLATVILLIVSLSWAVVVDLTPTNLRPFIGSSTDNTMMELITGHNGARRLGSITNLFSANTGAPSTGAPLNSPEAPNQPPRGQNQNPPPNRPPLNDDGQPNQPPQQQGGETGTPSIFRLFNEQLAGQISWLLPLAFFSLGIGLTAARLNWQLDLKHVSVILWGAWLVPQVIFFSFAGLFHRYYLEMLSPAIAALVGIGLTVLWEAWQENNWRGWLLPLAILIGAGGSVFIVARYYAEWSRWLTPLIGGSTVVVVISFIAISLFRYPNRIVRGAIFSLGLIALLIAPTVWASTPLAGADVGLPFAGPEILNRPQRGDGVNVDAKQLQYLQANRGDAKFMVAVLSAREAAPFIITTGEAVMAMGGFSGRDDILSPTDLAQYVANHDVRFFLVPRANTNAPNRPTTNQDNNDLVAWVNSSCKVVTELNNNATPRQPNQPNGDLQLFDCKQG